MNSQISISELELIKQKLDAHLQISKEDRREQKDLNQNLVSSIAQLSMTVAKIDSFQVELNHVDTRVADNKNDADDKISNNKEEITRLREKQYALNDKVTTIASLTDDFKQIKKIVIGFIVAALLGGSYITKTNNDTKTLQSDEMIKVMQLQVEALKALKTK